MTTSLGRIPFALVASAPTYGDHIIQRAILIATYRLHITQDKTGGSDKV